MGHFASSGTIAGSGQVTIDTAGNVAIKFTGGTANASYDAQFCPFPYVAPPNQCFHIANITADGSGAGNLNMKFPKSGTWGSGTFTIGTTTDFFNTADSSLHGTANFSLVPASGASGNAPSSLPQDPLSSGNVSIANQTVTVTVKGATPSSSYQVTQCGGPTQCFVQATLMTDASGNGSVSFATLSRPATEFDVTRRSGGTDLGSGFLSGFKVP